LNVRLRHRAWSRRGARELRAAGEARLRRSERARHVQRRVARRTVAARHAAPLRAHRGLARLAGAAVRRARLRGPEGLPGRTGATTVAIERREVRAAPGGIGTAKAAANYAASLRASSAALARGHTVALWLDAAEHRYIQELSGMNFFAVIDGELHTPELDGAILPGITRDSLLTLARHLGYVVHERAIEIDELLSQIEDRHCSELFACGTAAIV